MEALEALIYLFTLEKEFEPPDHLFNRGNRKKNDSMQLMHFRRNKLKLQIAKPASEKKKQ